MFRAVCPISGISRHTESIGRAVLSEAVRLTMEKEAERQTEMFFERRDKDQTNL